MGTEHQHRSIRNLVVSPNSQLAYGTALADGALTHRPRIPGDAFVSLGKNYQTDEAWYGKGHEYPTVRTAIEQMTQYQFSVPLSDFMAGWLVAMILNAVTTTGAGPYTHVFKPDNSTHQAKVSTIYVEDTAAIKTKYIDMAGAELTISGGASGVVTAQLSLVGSGKFTDIAMGALPAIATPVMLLGSDTDILIGPQAGAVSVKQYVRSWQWKITRALEIFRAPGGGLVAVQTNSEKTRASFSIQMRAKDTEVAGDPRTIFLADTIREVQINTNSGAAAQLKAKFPGCYLRVQGGMDGNFVTWQVDGTEEDVQKSGANEIVEVTAINSQATFLVGA